jgi:DNA-binding NarL/FixJ family response regulator
MRPARSLRVAVADDYAQIRTILRKILLTDPQIEVVGEAHSTADLIALCQSEKPDIVLLDLFMPGPGALFAVATLLSDLPSVKILVVSEEDEDVFVRVMARLPIAGYLLKGDVPDCLLEALGAVADDKRWFSPSLRALVEES